MELQVNPSLKVIQRAEKISEMVNEDERHVFLLDSERVMALLIARPFEPINYIGTTSFRYSRINKKTYYSLRPEGPWYRGKCIKKALRILGKKRVYFFLHQKQNDEPVFTVLLLGTKEGTIAIAPRHQKSTIEREETLLSILKGATNRFKRAIVYAGI